MESPTTRGCGTLPPPDCHPDPGGWDTFHQVGLFRQPVGAGPARTGPARTGPAGAPKGQSRCGQEAEVRVQVPSPSDRLSLPEDEVQVGTWQLELQRIIL